MTDVVKQYHAFKDKKQLRSDHTHFVCDTRIMKQLYNNLGTTFNGISNMPKPVELDPLTTIHDSIQKSVDSTYMHIQGQNIVFHVAYSSFDPAHIIANILEGLTFAVEKIPGKWPAIHSIHVKTPTSQSLPIYGKTANEAIKVLKETIKEVVKKVVTKSSVQVEVPNKSAGKKRQREEAPVTSKLPTKGDSGVTTKGNSNRTGGQAKKVKKQ
jgi:hypothetical protein